MLTHDEGVEVVGALALQLGRAASPRAALAAMVVEPAFGIALPVAPESVMALARAAVNLCMNDGWTHSPPWLCQLLGNVTLTPDIDRILKKVAVKQPDWTGAMQPDAVEALWLTDTALPFIDRRTFRNQLRRLCADDGSSVLIINGGKKAGKTYSVELLYHVLRSACGPASLDSRLLPIAVVPFQPGMGASLDPLILAQLIVRRITDQPKALPSLGDVTDDRRNERLVDWIVENAAATSQKWWVLLDGLYDPDLTEMTRYFVSKLIELLSIGKHKKALRLIITDYPPEWVIGIPVSQWESERILAIGEVDLEPFFTAVLRRNGMPPDPLAVKFAMLLSTMGLPEDETRLCLLNDRLRKVVTDAHATL